MVILYISLGGWAPQLKGPAGVQKKTYFYIHTITNNLLSHVLSLKTTITARKMGVFLKSLKLSLSFKKWCTHILKGQHFSKHLRHVNYTHTKIPLSDRSAYSIITEVSKDFACSTFIFHSLFNNTAILSANLWSWMTLQSTECTLLRDKPYAFFK